MELLKIFSYLFIYLSAIIIDLIHGCIATNNSIVDANQQAG